MADIFNFPHKESEGFRPATEGDSGTPQVLSNFQEFRRLVEENDVEFFIAVGAKKNGEKFGFIAGMLDPMTATGMLEYVKIQVVAG